MAAFSASAFSITSFSEVAFDFGGVVPPEPQQPTAGLFQYYDRYIEQERKAKQEALEQIEKEIALIEQEEKPLIDKAEQDAEVAANLLALQMEIDALRREREALMRMIDDEEAIFVLLASSPFN